MLFFILKRVKIHIDCSRIYIKCMLHLKTIKKNRIKRKGKATTNKQYKQLWV